MTPEPASSRRDFLKTTAGATLAASLIAPAGVHAAGNDTLRVGLVGCGGRGTGAAIEALSADPNVKLVAMGDVFEDRLQRSLTEIKKKVADKVDVKPEAQFVGLDAYQKVIDRVDVVLLATPPGFRPQHLRAAVEAGKHVFAEKPCAVDAPGVRSVLESCKLAEKKKLCVVSGLCLRSDNGFREAVKRIHGGQIGDVHTVFANDHRGEIWVKKRQPDWSDLTWQLRNWYYFAWLSGDFNVEQHVHFLDVAAWVLKGYPVRAIATGGRQVRTGPEYGHIYDHFAVVYEYENGARLVSNCRQQAKCKGDMSAQAFGSKGRAHLTERKDEMTVRGEGGQWTFEGPYNRMYQQEHDDLFAAIRKGTPINNGEYMAKSTLLAIMGRMAAYTGQEITWQMALNSKQELGPKELSWDMKLDVPEIAVPGVTKFV
jgi:predicted dehydrogenase